MLIVVFVLGVLSAPQAFCIDAVKIKHGNAVRTPSNPWAFCADRSDAVTFTGTADFLDKDGNLDADVPIVNVKWTVKLTGGSGRLRYDKDGDGVDEYYGSSFSTEPAKQGSVTFDIVPLEGQKAYNPGENTLKVTVTNCEDSDDHGSDEDQVNFIHIDLEQIDDNSPISPKNRMCSNAQDKYKNVKYKVYVTPTDETADLTISGQADVKFEDGSTTKSDVNDSTSVTLKGADGTYGSWGLTAAHVQADECKATITEKVFKFEFDKEKMSDRGGTSSGQGNTEPFVKTSSGDCSAPKVHPPDGSQNVAWVEWEYSLQVNTIPRNMFQGKVLAEAKITLNTTGCMAIVNYKKPFDPSAVTVGVSFGPISVSVPVGLGSGTAPNYGTSIAGADTSMKIDGRSAVDGGDVSHHYNEVGFPSWVGPSKTSKLWPSTGRSQRTKDKERTYIVAQKTPTAISFWCKWACGSNASKAWRPTDQQTSWVQLNKQHFYSTTVTENDGRFEIE